MKPLSCLLILLAPWFAGCVAMGGARRVHIEETERASVSFASVAAAEAFYEGMRLSSREDYTDANGGAFLFLVAGGEAVFHETHHFNAQVRMADIDRDQTIREDEAASYLRRMKQAKK